MTVLDINEKAITINSNKKLFVEDLKLVAPDSAEGRFIQGFVVAEAAQKCQTLNEDDNKKFIKKMDKADVKPWFTKYCSTSRTLTRGCWLYDFLGVLLTQVASDKESMMSKIANNAYKEALAPHHGWMLK